jgi:glutamate racemase
MPDGDFVYIGDTARAPYGDKPAGVVAGFAYKQLIESVDEQPHARPEVELAGESF